MNEKTNILSQPAPILDEISTRLSNLVHGNLMQNALFFFRNTYFYWMFSKI